MTLGLDTFLVALYTMVLRITVLGGCDFTPILAFPRQGGRDLLSVSL